MMAEPTERSVNRIDSSCTDHQQLSLPVRDVSWERVLGYLPLPCCPSSQEWTLGKMNIMVCNWEQHMKEAVPASNRRWFNQPRLLRVHGHLGSLRSPLSLVLRSSWLTPSHSAYFLHLNPMKSESSTLEGIWGYMHLMHYEAFLLLIYLWV